MSQVYSKEKRDVCDHPTVPLLLMPCCLLPEVQERLKTRESRFSLLASSWPLLGKQLSRTRVCVPVAAETVRLSCEPPPLRKSKSSVG